MAEAEEQEINEEVVSVGSGERLKPAVVTDEVVAPKEASYESIPANYQIKPNFQDKFKANPVKEIIRTVIGIKLSGKTYDSDSAKKWSNSIANDVNAQIKDLRMKRYKHIVQVVIGEMKGAGVKCGLRCVWDSETDGYTSETFINDTIFCLVMVFAVYLY